MRILLEYAGKDSEFLSVQIDVDSGLMFTDDGIYGLSSRLSAMLEEVSMVLEREVKKENGS